MNLYHRTFAAAAIIRDGFRDGEGPRGVRRGVWVYDEALDEQQGALGNVALVISGVPEAAVADFEWRHPDQARSFREFLVPADVLNRFPIVAIYPDTWSWIAGNFEYVGPLVDIGPHLARTDET
jgi:hypothetical protein